MTLSLLAVEVILRIFNLAPAGGLSTVTQREFERVPGVFTPSQRIVDRTVPQLPYLVTIDTLGYRGTGQLSRAKPPGEIRILLLGDSFTFGNFVDDDQTLPAQLERSLQAACSGSIRIINAGVGGSSIETAAVMADRSIALGVDVAVLTFTENDVTDLRAPMWDQLAANRAAKSHFPMSAIYPLARNLALWNLLLKAQATWRARQTAGDRPLRQAEGDVGKDSMLASLRGEYKQRLLDLRDHLSRDGVPLVFAIFPSHFSVYRTGSGEQVEWVDRVARAAGLTTVNYLDTLQRDGRPKEELYLLPYDGHPSAEGYAVAVPVLEHALTQLPALASRCAVNGDIITDGARLPDAR